MDPGRRRPTRVSDPGVLFLFSLLLVLFAPPAPRSAASVWTGFESSGHLLARYTFRTADGPDTDATDNDLFGQLRLDGTTTGPKAVELHLLGTLRLDLDGGSDTRGFNPFEDIGDTGDALTGYLYTAHLGLRNPVRPIRRLRVGRQAAPGGQPFFFDGVSAEFAPLYRVYLNAFGGIAAHLYELDADWGSDWLAGLAAETALTSQSLLRLDYLYASDTAPAYGGSDRSNHQLAAEVVYRILPTARVTARTSLLDGSVRDLRLGAWGALPAFELEGGATWYLQFMTLGELSHELAPFTDLLGESKPFQSVDLKVRKRFGTAWSLGGGLFYRGLLDDADESAFNRSFSRLFADLERLDLLLPGLDIVLTAEYWNDDRADFSSGGFDIGYRLPSFFDARLHGGTEFSLYRYDYYVRKDEQQHVRTWYLDGRFTFGRHYRGGLHYDFEDGFEDIHTLRAEFIRVF